MRAARDAAQAADRAKSRFLAAASHDLRQPGHAIGSTSRRYRPQRCRRSSATRWRAWHLLRALGAMFDALLDVSRMDAGAVVPRPEPSSISTR